MKKNAGADLWIAAGEASSAPAFLRSWESHCSGDFFKSAAGSAAVDPSTDSSSETKLVKDALHALQGIGAAITGLREQAAAFSLQPADKTVHVISTLWTLSSSTNALAKLLSEFALAGSHRYELDRFVEFFLGAGCADKPETCSSRSRRKRLAKNERKRSEGRKVLPGLLNQAFAAAIRTVLQAHSASLNSLLGSLSRRRCNSELVSDQHGGPLFGFGHGALSLVELHLHTGELRLQLQALTHICLVNQCSEAALRTDTDRFQAFPRGADLLTHLYNLLLEPDCVHLELLRFLFARTLDPYINFIRSCIYCATLEDPYGEFILEKTSTQGAESMEQSTLKFRSGVSTPVFLVQACTQILRAALQLEFLSKLPEIRESLGSLERGRRSLEEDWLKFEEMAAASSCKEIAELNSEVAKCQDDAGSKSEEIGLELSLEETGTEEDFTPEQTGLETTEEEVSLRAEETRSADRRHSNAINTGEGLVVPYRAQQMSAKFQEREKPHFFLSGYNRGASWLDVGLPCNPFSGDEVSVYGYISTLFADSVDGWEIRSNDLNEDGLLKKLVPELAQVGLLTLSKSADRRMAADVDLVRVLLNDDNLRVVREVEVVEEAASDIKLQPELQTCAGGNDAGGNGKYVQGGGTWVSSLRLVENCISPERSDQATTRSADIPISVVVEKTIVDEILTQYRLVSEFTVRVLQERLHLQEHYLALRRYYFMEAGDWADNFITALCCHKWGVSLGQHHQVEAQGMLEAALQKSCCDGDSYAERLHILRRTGDDTDDAIPEFVNPNRLEAFDFIDLEYHLEWPLDLVLTPDAFCLYKLVFRLLLRVKHAVFALGEINNSLQVMERPLRKFSSRNPDQQNRFRALQLFRHQIGHFVTAIQSHIHSQLLHVIWNEFLYAIQHEIMDMQDLEVVHYKYLNNAIRQCFLSPEMKGVKTCMDNIMQCLLDFRSFLRNIGGGDERDVCNNDLYSKVLELRSVFRENIRSLHRIYLKPEAQNQLSDFWTVLDYNGYFASAC